MDIKKLLTLETIQKKETQYKIKTLKFSVYGKFSDISFNFFHPDGWIIHCTDMFSHQGLYKYQVLYN